jgi:hypothetical protein
VAMTFPVKGVALKFSQRVVEWCHFTDFFLSPVQSDDSM